MSIEISTNASRQIRKLLDKQGLPQGGLRVAVKAGGCSGLSYVFDQKNIALPTKRLQCRQSGAVAEQRHRARPTTGGTRGESRRMGRRRLPA